MNGFVYFLQEIINGVVAGMGYAVVAVGMNLILGTMKVINFAHGSFYMLGAFVAAAMISVMHLPYWMATIVALLFVGLVGVLSDISIVRQLREKDEMSVMIATLGLSTLITNVAQLIFGANPEQVGSPYQQSVIAMGQIRVSVQNTLVVGVGVLLLIVMYFVINRTKIGFKLHATAQNSEGARLNGINVKLVYTITFGVGCALAALSGILVGSTTTIFTSMGSSALITSFIVVVLGGMGSITGTILAALILGVLQAMVAGYLSGTYLDLVGYIIMVVILLIRPQGLMGGRPLS
ncbi:branched-chain amino acid ABC transporter permease [Alicyclobacillus dauci]|uniref:Branched-chain amino acid ABC transporter permease n=1 Tax=Alicyclobacillus dauci TaxID=1475485 RepID=A0ABY6Z039_9BACL|nr:branched-chain amino acid ABC transporter permease [Alicyclobacillus dauci]WAH36197.1 branched-chain amino acid ABC transporter permease [Alicyclobacillus dauci]